MPNVASILKEEIVRLARKELRTETEGLKKASSQYRSEIAALKRRVNSLEKQVAKITRKDARTAPEQSKPESGAPVRFSASGLAKHRQRLGLSAGELGKILGVSAQSIYNWEAGKTRPRPQQIIAIAAVRDLGKREAQARLSAMAGRA